MDTEQKHNENIMELFSKSKLVKICAPMVRYSKLQFRNLVKKYDCDLCFTPMILADSFHLSEKARRNEFTTNKDDTPVIIQFAANLTDDFVKAAFQASPFCSGVDLNCGCPQRWARQQGLGCALLENPEKIFDMTRECRNRIQKPFSVSVKTRISNDLRKTVEICRQVEKAGASFLTIHARTWEHSTGDINEEALKLIKENINIPLVANGGLKSLSDCDRLKQIVGCDGVMIANGILQNPSIFSGTNETPIECVQRWVDICFNTTLSRQSYQTVGENIRNTIPERPLNLTFQCFHHHLVFMLEKMLPKRKRRIFNNFKKFQEVLQFLEVEMHVIPNLLSVEDFENITPLHMKYENDSGHLTTENILNNEDFDVYDDGKYFTSKVQAETENDSGWFDMFLENG